MLLWLSLSLLVNNLLTRVFLCVVFLSVVVAPSAFWAFAGLPLRFLGCEVGFDLSSFSLVVISVTSTLDNNWLIKFCLLLTVSSFMS